MSWQERLEKIEFKITTGDGKTFSPLWINGEKSKEFNVSIYDFINVDGSLVERKRPKSGKYNLVFYFQGDDNIDQADVFEKAANDSRPWEVVHPFYGTITGQPTSVSRDDTSYNVTKITVEYWETITDDYPNTATSPSDVINKKASVVNGLGIVSYSSGAKPESSDISVIKRSSTDTASKFNALQTKETLVGYNNALSTALKSADNLIKAPSTAIADNQKLLNLPATYDIPVTGRINAIYLAYLEIRSVITGKNDKYYFESLAATAIAALSTASVNPVEDDYITRDQVLKSSAVLLDTYNDYLNTVDDAQVDKYDVENAWSPDSELQLALYDLVMDTLGSLYQIAFDAKQERTIELEKDSNLFVLTHRFMGLDAEDKNLETFRTINNIKNEKLFNVPKGTKIRYFV